MQLEDNTDEPADLGQVELDMSKMKFESKTKRSFKKSSLVYFRLLMRFLAPLLCIVGYYVGIFMWIRLVRLDTTTDASVLFTSSQRTV